MHFRIAKVVLRTGLLKANRYLLAMQPGLPPPKPWFQMMGLRLGGRNDENFVRNEI